MFDKSLSLQFSGASIRNAAGKQAAQELRVQSSSPPHLKDEAGAETKKCVPSVRILLPVSFGITLVTRFCFFNSRREAGRRAAPAFSQAVVELLSPGAGPQQQLRGREGLRSSRVGHPSSYQQHA